MKIIKSLCLVLCLLMTFVVNAFELANCNRSQYYDPSLMRCQSCPANVSMVTSSNGFSCVCEEHSVPSGVARCKHCNTTEVVSADGTTCVPRRCQNTSGRFICRKCPSDYIAVTQNFDGSPMKEVLCVKCSRGYRPQNNVCVRCEACSCSKHQIVVRDICVPKTYLNARPKYEETRLHPNAVLNFVKHEYLCTQNYVRACRALAADCVRNLYTTDLAGPCRLWIQPKVAPPKGLPPLTIESTSADKNPGEFYIARGKDTLLLASAAYTSEGGLKFSDDSNRKTFSCLLPIRVKIGVDISHECKMNISELSPLESESTFGVYIDTDDNYKPVAVYVKKPNGYYIKRDTWSTSKFRRYFLVDTISSTSANMSSTVYLRTLLVRLQIQRDKGRAGSLRGLVSVEVQYATKSPVSKTVTTFVKVENDMPTAGVIRGLEIWGGILGSLLTVYAVVQWRGNLRRGGLHFSLVPILGGAIADALYFAAWLSTLHAVAAEAGTLGMTLPLSRYEEYIMKAFVYSAISLKFVKLAWINWAQCRCDIFLLDWFEYNSPFRQEAMTEKDNNWKAVSLAREWNKMQTERRAHPGYTVTIALLVLYAMGPWQSYLPQSQGYKWSVATIAWWSSYTAVLLGRFVSNMVFGPPTRVLQKICSGVGLSLLVFQEEYYAHYVHGRTDDSKDMRTMAGPLSTCRVVVAPQLRTVYKQLSSPEAGRLIMPRVEMKQVSQKRPRQPRRRQSHVSSVSDVGESQRRPQQLEQRRPKQLLQSHLLTVEGIAMGLNDSRQALLSQFLAAFFERALDGLNWVASERSVVERLLDVEVTVREAGSTSVLLYDPDVNTPSCFNVTWWGEEWALGTFDAMLFGSVMMTADNPLVAAMVTLTTWQVMKSLRSWLGIRNLREKTGIEILVIH